jgi:Bacterial Ig-like domain
MKRLLPLVIFLPSVFATAALAEPLRLLSTSPQFWATNVNASSQKVVSLTFDQGLRPGFWDWFGRDVLSPPSDLHTLLTPDKMTCTLEVRLDPGHVYVCALNGRGIPGVGFQTEKGVSLPPTFLVFQTAGNIAPQDAPPRVVRSVPQHGAAIDPRRVQSLTVTFDKPMDMKKHGLHMFENSNPVDLSKVQFAYSAAGSTFTLPFAFKASAQYRLELNDIHDIGFSAANRVPLWPAQISFSTGP